MNIEIRLFVFKKKWSNPLGVRRLADQWMKVRGGGGEVFNKPVRTGVPGREGRI